MTTAKPSRPKKQEPKAPASDAKPSRKADGMPEFGLLVDAQGMRAQLRALRWPHYVYALCDEDGAGFYVGVGKGMRALAHLAEARDGGQSLKCQLIRHLGSRLRFALVFCTDWRPYALALEAYFIRDFRENLTNQENGSVRMLAGWFDPRDERLHSKRLLEAAMDKLQALYRQSESDLRRVESAIAGAKLA